MYWKKFRNSITNGTLKYLRSQTYAEEEFMGYYNRTCEAGISSGKKTAGPALRNTSERWLLWMIKKVGTNSKGQDLVNIKNYYPSSYKTRPR